MVCVGSVMSLLGSAPSAHPLLAWTLLSTPSQHKGIDPPCQSPAPGALHYGIPWQLSGRLPVPFSSPLLKKCALICLSYQLIFQLKPLSACPCFPPHRKTNPLKEMVLRRPKFTEVLRAPIHKEAGRGGEEMICSINDKCFHLNG